MPMTPFDWIVRTAMLVMAGLVTLAILGAIAAMTNDPGTRFDAAGDRPLVEGQPAEPRETAPAPFTPEEGPEGTNVAVAPPAEGRSVTAVAAAPAPAARWLEAIAYALLAVAGIGALGVLMLWSAVRELRRIGRAPPPQ